jgi:hypothetical protein
LWDRYLKMAPGRSRHAGAEGVLEALVTGWDRPEIRAAMKACLSDESASVDERCGAISRWLLARAITPRSGAGSPQFYEKPLAAGARNGLVRSTIRVF